MNIINKKNKILFISYFLYIVLFFIISINFKSNVFAQEKETKEEEFQLTKEEEFQLTKEEEFQLTKEEETKFNNYIMKIQRESLANLKRNKPYIKMTRKDKKEYYDEVKKNLNHKKIINFIRWKMDFEKKNKKSFSEKLFILINDFSTWFNDEKTFVARWDSLL